MLINDQGPKVHNDSPDSRAMIAALVRAIPTLSPAELRVCLGVLDGKSARQLADELGVSERTIQNQRQSIRRKMGARENLQVELTRVTGAA